MADYVAMTVTSVPSPPVWDEYDGPLAGRNGFLYHLTYIVTSDSTLSAVTKRNLTREDAHPEHFQDLHNYLEETGIEKKGTTQQNH